MFWPSLSQAEQFKAKSSSSIKSVKHKDVCMVADRVPGEPTIPVKLEGKTYYVCCENCEARIRAERSIRFAFDPLTGRKVDKSKAFIVAKDNGEIIYFESERSAQRYLSPSVKR